MKSKGFIYNFVIEEYEEITEWPEDWHDYLPQKPTAQNLYGLYVDKLDETPLEAAKKVLEACCGMLPTDSGGDTGQDPEAE